MPNVERLSQNARLKVGFPMDIPGLGFPAFQQSFEKCGPTSELVSEYFKMDLDSQRRAVLIFPDGSVYQGDEIAALRSSDSGATR